MRHFWLALKEGAVEHQRALLTIAGIVVGLLLAVHLIFFFSSRSARVCGSCHIMDPYIEMWEASTHRDVACVECHGEWRHLISSTYVKYALGLYTMQLRAEVPDKRCLGCHEKQDLDTDEMFLRNIHFSHKGHLGEMRRGKALHCTSCHSGTGVASMETGDATHIGVDESVCFTCHFKGAEQGQAVTGCLVCHGPPAAVVTHQGFQFDHGTYIQRGVRCDHCHVQVTRGDANVPRGRCATCHVSRIEAYDDHERVHEIHLKQRQIDCKRCHSSMEHGKVAMAAALGESCESCHLPAHTPQEQMYIGIGGQGVADTPSTMFLARVACDSCHQEPGGDPRQGAEELRRSCVTCHGPGFDRMVDDWINETGALLLDVTATVQRAEAQARVNSQVGRAYRSQLARARHNLEFVRNARGEHNIHYAVELLRVANDDAAEVLASTGASVPARSAILASASGYCRVCHSTSHLGTRLPFAETEYDHNRHLKAGLTCDTCHSVAEHGETTIQRQECMGCHHGGDQKRSCESCHNEQASFYNGSLEGTDVRGDADVMAEAGVECDSCHNLDATEPVVRAVQQACVDCHEEGFDEMLVEWINSDQEQVQQLAVLIARAQTQLSSEGEQVAASHRSALRDAQRIYGALVSVKGTHNVSLADDAYRQAKKLLEWVAR